MKAMILAAGKGTRMKPLTDEIPKALIKVNDKPLLEIVIKKLINQGFSEFVINTHYKATQIHKFLESKNNFGVHIDISHEQDQLLDTGGGLLFASRFFNHNEPILIHNVDIISDIDFNEMISYHNQSPADATLAVRKRQTSRYLLFDNKLQLCGWENVNTHEKKIAVENNNYLPFGFSGIHIIHPKLLRSSVFSGRFSIIDLYLEQCKNYDINGYDHSDGVWYDLGKIEQLEQISAYLK